MRLRDLERSTASASPARGSSHSTLVCDHVEPLKRGDAFGSVDGERIWLAMHGHDVRWTKRTTPASLFHSRVLDSVQSKQGGAGREVARSLRVGSGPDVRVSGRARSSLKRRWAIGATRSFPRSSTRVARGRSWQRPAPPGGRSRNGIFRSAFRWSSTTCPRIPWQHLDLLDGTYTFG